jgi:hypothetical protein
MVAPMLTYRTGAATVTVLTLLGCSHGGAIDPIDGSAGDAGMRLDLPALLDLRPQSDLRKPPSAEVRFAAAATVPGGQFAWQLAVGRLDLDDQDDLLFSGRPAATAYLSHGDGTLEGKPLALSANWQVAIADVNRDGKGDALLTDTSNGQITISLGSGDGSFAAPRAVKTGGQPQGVAAADVSGDGIADLLVVDQMGGRLLVFLGKGDGDFTPGQTLPTGSAPLWVTIGDVNGDRHSDAVVVDLSSASFHVYLGIGDGSFAAGLAVPTIRSPVALQLGDLNQDGNLDAAVNGEGADRCVAVHLGDGKGGFGPATKYPTSDGSGQGIGIADLNLDGYPDLIASSASTSAARVFLGAGGGTFLSEKLFPGGTSSVFNLAAVDLNRDGLPDIVLSEASDRKISVLINTTPR